ncbi:ionotropic receptor 76b isoform X2 [Lycorma delicatula]|uniref:ionotropic receptor 76b isoform X2 n=1 Tax=Lycorma delicatula TaxID=130591 RepID=UPI003F519249
MCSNYHSPGNNNNITLNSPGTNRRNNNNNTTNNTNFTCILKDDTQIRQDLLRGKRLKIATLQNDWPLSGVSVNSSGSIIGGGIAFQIVKTLQELYGFSYTVSIPSQNILGDEKSGILGLLYSGVDMAAAFIPILHSRHSKLQWGTELIQNKYFILMKRPTESASGSGLLAPFEIEVWMLILLSLLVVGPIMYAIIRLRDKLCHSSQSKRFPMSNCMWFVYGALMKQGSTLNPITDSSRMLFATWWLFVMILTAFYTANLTAFLTLSKFTLPIQTIEDIGKQSHRWFTSEGGALEYAIKVDGDLNVLRYSVAHGLGYFVDINDNEKVKQHIAKGWLYLNEIRSLEQFVFDDYINKTIKGVLEKDRCTYVVTKDSYLTRSMAFAFPKHSILPSLFNPVMLSYVESGIITHLASKSLPNNPICPLDLRSKERQLRNSDLLTTYIVIISGFIAASIAFIFELLWRNYSSTSFKTTWPLYDVINYNNNNNKKSKHYPKWKRRLMSITNKNPIIEINGREYYSITTHDGTKRLIPVRPLSSFLFQYK